MNVVNAPGATRGYTAWVLLFLPLLLNFAVFVVGGLPKIEPSTALQKIIPPGWVFSAVWTVNYLCLGAVWSLSGDSPITHCIVVPLLVLLLAWTPVYQEGKLLEAFYIIMASVFFVLLLFSYVERLGRMLLCPLLAWLLTAAKFSYDELDNK